ncbi:YusW family protein [Sporosarcina jiandibaonis]|uniref:YusW family protein n=1 Tax=Sporosarcina jiandibaonis TaxID=2715535 RepID=UPI001552D768|nr:YusW family protein [Sporosarcina jiandibaonis]
MRKSKFLMITIFASVFLVVGCGNNNNDNKRSVESRDEPLISAEIEDRDGSYYYGAGYGFLDFDLEIDIDGKDAIDINYEVDKQNDTFEAEYKNNIENFHLKNEEAMNAIDEFFNEVLLNTENKSKEDLMREILESLNIEDYSKFDLEITYDDNSTLTIQESN